MKNKTSVAILAGFFLGGVLTGCQRSFTSEEARPVLEFVPPTAVSLEDASGNRLGYGVVLRPGVLVTPDHLWQTSEALYYQEKPIQVLARDFRHDVLFFTVPQKLQTTSLWSTEPPGVGQTLEWRSDLGTALTQVFSAKAPLELGNVALERLMLIDQAVAPGDSGKPLYDPNTGKVYGMVVAANPAEAVSYFVRSDVILQLAQEYLENN